VKGLAAAGKILESAFDLGLFYPRFDEFFKAGKHPIDPTWRRGHVNHPFMI
jgi:hypothetical protein